MSPLDVTAPILAHISCIDAINGNVMRDVQSVVNPNLAPAWEYVAIPDGSSSLAPVISPGPSDEKNFLIVPGDFLGFASAVFFKQ